MYQIFLRRGKEWQTEQLRIFIIYFLEDFRFNIGKINWKVSCWHFFYTQKSE